MPRLIAYLGIGAVAAVLTIWLVTLLAPSGRPTQQAAVAPSGPVIGGPFTLVDENGKTVTDADFRGRYLLVFFGYTFCPDVCPTTLQTIAGAMDLLGAEADKVQPLFISVDPDRDTPKVLKSFVRNFGARIIGLTGSHDQLAAVAKAYRVYFAKVREKGAAEEDYLMDHSAAVYLMGPDGKFITNFSYGITAEDLAGKLKQRLG